MKHFNRLITASEALQRVFFTGLKPVSNLISPICRQRIPPRLISHQQQRYAQVFKSRQVQEVSATTRSDTRLRDEEIDSYEVHVVSSNDNRLQPPEPLDSVLYSMDRKLNWLVQVSPPESQDIPICKIMDKAEMRAAERSRSKQQKATVTQTKQLEVGWGIDPHDFQHRMKQMKGFLEDGRRLEIVFGKQRKGWKAKRKVSEEEMRGLVEKVRENVRAIEGAKEWQPVDGEMGAQMKLFFERPKRKVVEKKNS